MPLFGLHRLSARATDIASSAGNLSRTLPSLLRLRLPPLEVSFFDSFIHPTRFQTAIPIQFTFSYRFVRLSPLLTTRQRRQLQELSVTFMILCDLQTLKMITGKTSSTQARQYICKMCDQHTHRMSALKLWRARFKIQRFQQRDSVIGCVMCDK